MKISIHNKKDEAHNGHWGKEKYGNLYKTIARAENRDELGEECWLDFPSDAFKLWPRASGEHRCSYPHHIIEDGDTMILSVPGVKAAYARAKQQGVFSGKIKEHLERHYRELELYEGSTMDTDNKIEENFQFIESYLTEDIDDGPPTLEDVPVEAEPNPTTKVIEEPASEKPESLPKQTDAAESDKNGVNRKKLYIEFIEYAKRIRIKNTFGSMFDKDGFNVTYPFVPDDMRYFYRLANPLLCVLENNLTFFALSELRKVNTGNDYKKLIVFAATTELIYFRLSDQKIYSSSEDISTLVTDDTKLSSATLLADSFDQYIEQLVGKQVLNG